MTTDDSLAQKIRSCVLEIVDSAPPAPELQLDELSPSVHPWWTPRRTAVMLGGLAIVISVVVVTSLLVSAGSSQEVSESQLGLQFTSLITTKQPVQFGQVPVATGTFFGHPWLVSGSNTTNMPGGQLCVGFSYRGSVLSWTCGSDPPTTSPPLPSWYRSDWVSSLHTASDGQRFFFGATNSTVTKVTVRAQNGDFVRTSALPEHLGNASFFVLSLGRERGGPCYGLCLGTVTYSVSTPSGAALIGGQSSFTIQDRGGDATWLSAPVRGSR